MQKKALMLRHTTHCHHGACMYFSRYDSAAGSPASSPGTGAHSVSLPRLRECCHHPGVWGSHPLGPPPNDSGGTGTNRRVSCIGLWGPQEHPLFPG